MKGRILVIEDNEQNLYLVKFILENNGYEVCEARDGREGIEMAEKIKPDLAKVPIVAVTSYAMAGDREKAIAAGCNGYIEKPINPDIFMQQVEQQLCLRADGGEGK